jgi:hypothetical protein
MLRTSLAFLSVALLLSSPAQAQMRGGGGGAMSMSGMGAGCASGSNGAGALSSQARTAAGTTNTTGFGTNAAAAYYGMGVTPNALMAGAGNSTMTNTAAAYYGMGGYGVTAWPNPYAQVMGAYGNSLEGFGAPYGMNDGFSSFAWYEPNFLSDPFTAAVVAAERGSTDTMPRTRTRSTKAKSKLKRRSTAAKRTSF